ncbi:TetR/AcrR family transcriptional regulator [Vibrio chagasii]|uniref:TetR/AcrR family transcriptional regulator n=1 Tax=Vibrio chagasii TaxID=170679 RepID=A0A7Y3YQC9_9VIBR|nr:TetR/AcrR family transcriptional regulator [Vibrio chagasii]NOH34378.1 TetR/AcrR family transcriptional regulator [Vibrio chagasii]
MGKIEQNKEKKRLAILKAAKDIFLAEGYAQTSMDRVASEAKMTKQTLYRYFSSKDVLFEATLRQMGSQTDDKLLVHLQQADTRQALVGFAKDFVAFHLSNEHIATFKLLIAEGSKSPELVSRFMEVGPDDTDRALMQFFNDRFNTAEPKTKINLWLGMVMSLRDGVLMGMPTPTEQEIEVHVKASTDLLLAALDPIHHC